MNYSEYLNYYHKALHKVGGGKSKKSEGEKCLTQKIDNFCFKGKGVCAIPRLHLIRLLYRFGVSSYDSIIQASFLNRQCKVNSEGAPTIQ